MRLPEHGEDVRLLNGTFVKVQQYLYTERDIAERTREMIHRRHRVMLENFKIVFVVSSKSAHLKAWVQSNVPDDAEGLYEVDGISALKIGTAYHQRRELDEEILMLQRRIALTK